MPIQTSVRLTFTLAWLLLFPFSTIATDLPQTSDQIARISVSELLQLLEDEPVVIVDARIPRAWKRAGNKIPGAIRLDTPEQIAQLTDTSAHQQAIVLYCL
jgi:hypothetical protein